MRSNAYQNYFDDEILTADPVKLVVLLYRGAIEAIGSAREQLAHGDIRGRSASINKALDILTELAQTLDMAQGGELSLQLARLYDYVQRLLIEANIRQQDAPLQESEGLLNTLLEGWQGCLEAQVGRPQKATVPAMALMQEETAEVEQGSFSYSY